MKFSKRSGSLRLMVVLMAMALLLAACPSQAGPAAPAGEEAAAPTAEEATGGEAPAAEEPTTEEPAMGRGAGDTVNILYWQAVSILNPYLSGGTKDIDGSSVVLESLARYDENGNLVAWLAEEIPTVENGGVAEDLTSITWKLRDDILWADGTPFTAEDVVFTGEYCMDPDMGCNAADRFQNVESIEALDDYTVQISFDKPKPFPYGPFVSGVSPVLQKTQFQDCMGAKAQECSEQNFNPIGTGPYKVKEFRANDVVTFEINENYREPDKPYFKEVVLKGGGDAAAAARAVLETGEADYAWNLQVEPQILEQMEAAGQGVLLNGFGTAVERLMVNFTNPSPDLGDQRSVGLYVYSPDDPNWCPEEPEALVELCSQNPHPFLSDYNVRRALSLAIDRSVIAEQLYGPGGEPGCNVVPNPEIYVSTNNDECLTQDIEGAQQLLEESGWVDEDGDGVREKDGVRLSILYQTSTNPVRQKTQALVKQWWEQIGVETELRNIDSSVFFGGDPASPDTYGKFYADIEMYTNTFDGTDPEDYMKNWLCEAVAAPFNQWLGNNIPRWCSPGYEDLAAELAQTADLNERAQLVIAMNDMLMQQYVMIPLITRADVSARSSDLGGVRMNAWDSELWNIADWYRTQ